MENNYHLDNIVYAYHNSIKSGSMNEEDMKSDILIQNLNKENSDRFVKKQNDYPILKWEENK